MKTQMYDVVVIGAGSGGLTSAVGLAKAGKRVLLVEREHMGGECTNTGCIPSKALLHHARDYWHAARIAGHTTTGETYRRNAFTYVTSVKNKILEHETPEHFAAIGITVLMGEAVFIDKNSIQVDDTIYQFKKAIIATGSQPRLLELPNLEPKDYLTNQTVFDITAIPERLLIIGSGPIGLELGQAFAMLGSQVTIATTASELGTLEDPAVQPNIEKARFELGIAVAYNAFITSVQDGQAEFECRRENTATKTFTCSFDSLLVAIGRVPNLPTGLETAGVDYTQHGITVDANYRTTNHAIYALGDVADRLKFTHVADTVARGVVTHIISHGLMGVKIGAIPKVTYTEPEIAQVGMSWSEAVGAFGADRLYRLEIPLAKLDRAITDDTTAGVFVVIVKRLSGTILGAHMAGPRAGEIIALLTLAIDNKLSLWRLGRTTYAYPTYAQLIKLAATTFLATQLMNLASDLGAFLKRHFLKTSLIIGWIIVVLWLYTYLSENGYTPTLLAIFLFEFFSQSIWGPVLFIATYILRPLTFLPATSMTILAGTFFGFWWGLLYTLIGANLSASLAYGIGRFLGKKTPNTQPAASGVGSFFAMCRTSPFMSILVMRLLFLPYDVVNYGAGILRVPYVPYITATVLGTALGTAMFVSLGASISIPDLAAEGISTNIVDRSFIMLSVAMFAISLLASKVVSRFYKSPRLTI